MQMLAVQLNNKQRFYDWSQFYEATNFLFHFSTQLTIYLIRNEINCICY